MPQRHASHQTGTAALRAFQSALPKAWTFDTPDGDNDYGVDGSVRLFLPTGEPLATGFDVQIKGTDEPDLRRALRLSFEVETLAFYLVHDRPVLLVRYHEPTDGLYVKWSHRPLRRPPKPGQKTTTVQWDADDLWTGDTPGHLLRDTVRYRTAVSAGLPLPVSVGVRVEAGQSLTDRDAQCLRRAFRDIESPVVEIDLSPSPDAEPLVEVLIDPSGVHIDVARVTGATLDLPPRFDGQTDSDGLVSSALVLLGLRLSALGHHDPGARLVEAHLPTAPVQTIPAVALPVAVGLFAADRAHTVTRYATALLDGAEEHFTNGGDLDGLDTIAVLLWIYRAWAPADRSDLDGLVDRYTQLVVDHAPNDVAASALLDHAAHLRAGRQEPERNHRAFALYNMARHLDDRLCADPGFLAAVAGVLYDLLRYRRSADLYAQAIKRGADTDPILARYGDALLMSGWFGAAALLTGRYTSDGVRPPSALWLLKQLVAERLAAEYGDAPERDQSGAARWVSRSVGDTDAHAQAARAALALDPLNVSACHNLAVWHDARDEAEQAAWLFARIAVVQPGDDRAWADAFFRFIRLASSGRPSDDLNLALIMDAALASRERPFLVRVHEVLDENGEDAHTQAVEAILDRARSARRIYGSLLLAPEPKTY